VHDLHALGRAVVKLLKSGPVLGAETVGVEAETRDCEIGHAAF